MSKKKKMVPALLMSVVLAAWPFGGMPGSATVMAQENGVGSCTYVVGTNSNSLSEIGNDNGYLGAGGVVCFPGDTIAIIPAAPFCQIHSKLQPDGVSYYYARDITSAYSAGITGSGLYEMEEVKYSYPVSAKEGTYEVKEDIDSVGHRAVVGDEPVLVKYDPNSPYTDVFNDGASPLASTDYKVYEGLKTETLSGNSYPVTYDLDGGILPDGTENPESVAVKKEDREIPFTVPVRLGYTFSNWNLDVHNSVMYSQYISEQETWAFIVSGLKPANWTRAKEAVAGCTATAQWNAANVDLVLDLNGGLLNGSYLMRSQSFEADEEHTAYYNSYEETDTMYLSEHIPQRHGYTFNGWYIGDTRITQINDIPSDAWNAANVYTLTAGWEEDPDADASDSVKWRFDTNGTLTVSGNGDMDDYSYVSDAPWADYADIIEKVVVREGITRLGTIAFASLTGLQSVSLPKTLTLIGQNAFAYDDSLESVTIPEGVSGIGYGAFSGCTALRTVTLPSTLTQIDECAFSGCTALEEIVIPDGVESIPAGVFENCTGLKKVVIPDSVKTFGENIFYWYPVDENGYYLKDDMRSIDGLIICCSEGSKADAYARAKGITVSYSNSSKPEHTHAGTLVKAAAATCTEAGSSAYYICTCGKYFSDAACTKELAKDSWIVAATGHKWDGGTVTKEPTAKEEGIRTYHCTNPGCAQTKTEVIPRTAEEVPSNGTVLTDTKTGFRYQVSSTGSTNPTVTYMGTTDKKAKTIAIPAKVTINGVSYQVTAVADKAFKGNKTITKVTLGSNITVIGKDAFNGCKKLKTVTAGKSITTIGSNAFKGCSVLGSLTLPAKVAKIDANAFNGCKKLKTLTIKSTKLTSRNVAKNAFKGLTKATTIKVPKSKLSAYKSLFKKKGLSSKVKVKK